MTTGAPITVASNQERSEVLADALCEEIICGALKPGEKLNEASIAKRFNISRGPVREALRRLSERELVDLLPNAGARVMRYTLSDMLNLLEVRESLELFAVRLAAKRMSHEEIEYLHNLYETHSSNFSSNNQDSYFQSPEDLDFHYVIAKGAKNPVLFKILCEDLYPRLRLCRRQHKHITGRGVEALKEHHLVLKAIEGQDPELAEFFMQRHLQSARETLKTSIDILDRD